MRRIIFYIKLATLLCGIGILPIVFPLLGWILFQDGVVLLWIILGLIYIWQSLRYEIKNPDISPSAYKTYRSLAFGILIFLILLLVCFIVLLGVYLAKDLLKSYYLSVFTICISLSLAFNLVVAIQLYSTNKNTKWYRFMTPFTIPVFIVFSFFATYTLFQHIGKIPKAQLLLKAEKAAQYGNMEECKRNFLDRLAIDKNFRSSSKEENEEFAQRECEIMSSNDKNL